MKNFKSTMSFLLIMLLVTSPLFSQAGIHGGVNVSYFTDAVQPWDGMGNKVSSFTGGVYESIPLTKCTFINVEADYIQTGAYNPVEHTTFRVHNVFIPVTAGVRISRLDLQAGMYTTIRFRSSNYNFSGVDTFAWGPDWDYYKQVNGGIVVAAGYDMTGARIQARAIRSLWKVQGKDYGDPKKLGYDACGMIELYIPLKTFTDD